MILLIFKVKTANLDTSLWSELNFYHPPKKKADKTQAQGGECSFLRRLSGGMGLTEPGWGLSTHGPMVWFSWDF